MFFIVDSGSTKSDWVLVESSGHQAYFSTMGFNPYFHPETVIAETVLKHPGIMQHAREVEAVYFYGAGCADPAMQEIVSNALSGIFTSAKISVDQDLMACAHASYDGEPAISCIIGTGSNSCYFDGKTLSKKSPSLGYILGDEGSGSYFGKQLLSAYFYGQLPANLSAAFAQEFALTRDELVERIYRQSNANVYLASFTTFISEHASEPYFREMVYEGMKKFMEIHVCCYPNYRETEVHFVGSIAYVFAAELRRAAGELGITTGKIIQKPIDSLVAYHLQNRI
ncbi:MAG: ATPase [Bacteroidota bacterium]